MGVDKSKNRNQRVRVSTTLDESTRRALDAAAAERGRDRSAVVEEAVEAWLASAYEEDAERATRLERLEQQMERQTERLAGMVSEAQIHSEMAVAAMGYQFPPVASLGLEELRRRALAARRRKRRPEE